MATCEFSTTWSVTTRPGPMIRSSNSSGQARARTRVLSSTRAATRGTSKSSSRWKGAHWVKGATQIPILSLVRTSETNLRAWQRSLCSCQPPSQACRTSLTLSRLRQTKSYPRSFSPLHAIGSCRQKRLPEIRGSIAPWRAIRWPSSARKCLSWRSTDRYRAWSSLQTASAWASPRPSWRNRSEQTLRWGLVTQLTPTTLILHRRTSLITLGRCQCSTREALNLKSRRW